MLACVGVCCCQRSAINHPHHADGCKLQLAAAQLTRAVCSRMMQQKNMQKIKQFIAS